ncbi:MAG: multidrug efflux SMR transporter [Planctomycetia bacterium]|nr:multidrug efflux SMR transporter [Planctomycetia bacterium]
MSWLFLFLAAAAEIVFVFEMKLSDGFTKIGHAVASLIIMSLGVFFLSIAIRRIPVATGYAVWTGLGIIGTVFLESWYFQEPFSLGRIACIALILTGVIGLKLL